MEILIHCSACGKKTMHRPDPDSFDNDCLTWLCNDCNDLTISQVKWERQPNETLFQKYEHWKL